MKWKHSVFYHFDLNIIEFYLIKMFFTKEKNVLFKGQIVTRFYSKIELWKNKSFFFMFDAGAFYTFVRALKKKKKFLRLL